MSLVTPENLPGVLTAIGVILSAIGGWTLWKVGKEPPPSGSIEATRAALAQNTEALNALNKQFADNFSENIRLFRNANEMLKELMEDISESKHHLAAIREGINAMRYSVDRRS